MNMKAKCIKRIVCKVVVEDYIERDHTKRNEGDVVSLTIYFSVVNRDFMLTFMVIRYKLSLSKKSRLDSHVRF